MTPFLKISITTFCLSLLVVAITSFFNNDGMRRIYEYEHPFADSISLPGERIATLKEDNTDNILRSYSNRLEDGYIRARYKTDEEDQVFGRISSVISAQGSVYLLDDMTYKVHRLDADYKMNTIHFYDSSFQALDLNVLISGLSTESPFSVIDGIGYEYIYQVTSEDEGSFVRGRKPELSIRAGCATSDGQIWAGFSDDDPHLFFRDFGDVLHPLDYYYKSSSDPVRLAYSDSEVLCDNGSGTQYFVINALPLIVSEDSAKVNHVFRYEDPAMVSVNSYIRKRGTTGASVSTDGALVSFTGVLGDQVLIQQHKIYTAESRLEFPTYDKLLTRIINLV